MTQYLATLTYLSPDKIKVGTGAVPPGRPWATSWTSVRAGVVGVDGGVFLVVLESVGSDGQTGGPPTRPRYRTRGKGRTTLLSRSQVPLGTSTAVWPQGQVVLDGGARELRVRDRRVPCEGSLSRTRP